MKDEIFKKITTQEYCEEVDDDIPVLDPTKLASLLAEMMEKIEKLEGMKIKLGDSTTYPVGESLCNSTPPEKDLMKDDGSLMKACNELDVRIHNSAVEMCKKLAKELLERETAKKQGFNHPRWNAAKRNTIQELEVFITTLEDLKK